MANLVAIGVPIDSVGRSGGTEIAPQVLRELGLPAAVGAEDLGDLEVRIRGDERDPDSGLLAADDVLATTAVVRREVAEAVVRGERPMLVGGCCALLPGALAGARDAHGDTVGLAHVDGHADLYDGGTSPTGEAADMPASVALGLGPKAWVEAAGGPSTDADRLALIGYRDEAESVREGMRQPGDLTPAPAAHPLELVRARGASTLGEEVAVALGEAGPFWVHLDVDVLDPEAFPATDYIQPDGLGWEEATELLAPLLRSWQLIGLSIACYNPDKDPGLACGCDLIEALATLSPPHRG